MYSTEDITGVKWDVVILGGGIAGLTASILLAQEGKKVLVLEKGGNLGGRGISSNLGKAHVNLGPHALFTDTLEEFNEVGVNITGKSPKLSGGAFVFGKDNEKMNVVDIVNLFLGSHLKWKEKMEFISNNFSFQLVLHSRSDFRLHYFHRLVSLFHFSGHYSHYIVFLKIENGRNLIGSCIAEQPLNQLPGFAQ